MRITPRLLRFVLNSYGPYVGAGVHVSHISDDWREVMRRVYAFVDREFDAQAERGMKARFDRIVNTRTACTATVPKLSAWIPWRSKRASSSSATTS